MALSRTMTSFLKQIYPSCCRTVLFYEETSIVLRAAVPFLFCLPGQATPRNFRTVDYLCRLTKLVRWVISFRGAIVISQLTPGVAVSRAVNILCTLLPKNRKTWRM